MAPAIWRSVTPELAPARGGTLLSVMQCVNDTGGCSQLPRGFEGRIRHGVRIDPKTLRGEAGFYGDRDPIRWCPCGTRYGRPRHPRRADSAGCCS